MFVELLTRHFPLSLSLSATTIIGFSFDIIR